MDTIVVLGMQYPTKEYAGSNQATLSSVEGGAKGHQGIY